MTTKTSLGFYVFPAETTATVFDFRSLIAGEGESNFKILNDFLTSIFSELQLNSDTIARLQSEIDVMKEKLAALEAVHSETNEE